MIPLLSTQLREFLFSGVVGLGLGLGYDLLRSLRRKRRGWTAALDFLFALVFFLTLLLLSLYTMGLKLYQCLGILLGSSLYFLVLSPCVLRCFGRILGALGAGKRRAGATVKKSVCFLRKVAKKFFSSWKKWSTIDAIPFFRRRKNRSRFSEKSGAGNIEHSGCSQS